MNKMRDGLIGKIVGIVVDYMGYPKQRDKLIKELLDKTLKAHTSRIVGIVEGKVKDLLTNSEARSSKLECSQDGYEFGIEDIKDDILKAIKK